MPTYITIRPRLRTAVIGAEILFGGLAVLLRPAAVAGGISRGLSICGSIIIPSLFPFLVLGGFLLKSGVATALGNRLHRLTRVLFGLPGCCAAGILLGFIGGYPAGGAAVGELVRSGQITREEGRRMLRFCVCGGPGFIIGTVGANLMGSTTLGVILFAAHIVSALLIGVFSAPRGSRRRRYSSPIPRERPSASTAFVGAVTDAGTTLLSMCGFILLFSGILSLLDTDNQPIGMLLSCFLEVSGGCVFAAASGALAPFLLGLTVGFGGLSVHCQVAAALAGTDVITPSFWLSRALHGLLNALLTLVLLRMIPITLPVFGSTSTPVVRAVFDHVGLSVFLLLLCGIWLLCVDKGGRVTYNKTHS